MREFKTREEWLTAAAKKMTPWFAEAGGNEVPKIRVSCSWTKRAKANAIGWCWGSSASADGVNEIQISPEKADGVDVLAILVHELVHASDNCESGHVRYFRTTAKALGLEGKMTATVPGVALKARLTALAEKLGPYPHAALSPTGKRTGKQSTRMLKVECPDCTYTVRTTRKWLDVGTPTCPCGSEMEEAA